MISEKVGQLLFIGIQKYYIDSETLKLLKKIQPGGIILLKRNLQSIEQIIDLIKGINRLLKIKPFIGIDQEGGRVQRLYGIFPTIPSLQEIASNYSLNTIKKLNYRIAQSLKMLGININFHPVVDLIYEGKELNKLNDRCISSNPKIVVKVAGEILNAYNKAGIFCCFKHFPGLGCTQIDSHIELPICPLNFQELWDKDLLPYRMYINKIPIIMIGHCNYQKITKDKISSLSYDLIYGLLKKKLNYNGLIISDDLEMAAITNFINTPLAATDALKAGCDMIMICHSYEVIQEIFDRINSELEKDNNFKNIIEEKINKILKYKEKIDSIKGNKKKLSSLFSEISTLLLSEREI